MSADDDRRFMQAALDAAREALERGDLPIGAAVVIDGELVSTAGNEIVSGWDESRHAEMVAVGAASRRLIAARRTDRIEVFTTMEPCAMCVGALVHFRVQRVVSALDDHHAGAVDCLDAHHYYGTRGIEWERGPMAEEAAALVEEFRLRSGLWQRLRFVERNGRMGIAFDRSGPPDGQVVDGQAARIADA